MTLNFKSILNYCKTVFIPHALVVIGFALGSVFYFYPVLQGKVIYQSDIVQYRGMSKQFLDYQDRKGDAVYWTDSAFGGMPTYQLGAEYPDQWIKYIDKVLRFLPRPADYLFLYLLCFYILMLVVLKGDRALSILGAVGFGLATYHLVILGVGHNAKAHAIAYMPLVLSGLLLLFQKRTALGFVVLSLGSGLEIAANHFQMTYYLAFLILAVGIYYAIEYYRQNQFHKFLKMAGLGLIAGLLALGMNATSILATSEYAKESTRGDNLLTTSPDGSALTRRSGLEYDYITEYSYGISESLNLLIPGLLGGSNNEKLNAEASSVDYLLTHYNISSQEAIDFAGKLMYWGNQPFVAAPAYVGIILMLFFAVYMRLSKSKSKYWLLGTCLLALMLSWGKNLELLTNIFIDYVPLYNKFRAVSSIQVIISLLIPVGAMLGLKLLLSEKISTIDKIKSLKQVSLAFLALFLLVFIFRGNGLDFIGSSDSYIKSNYGPDLLRSVRLDRESLFISDLIRSAVLSGLTILSLYFYLKQSIGRNLLLVLLFGYIVFDLSGVGKRYVSADDFTLKSAMNTPFEASQADKTILKDSTHFRVLDLTSNPFNSARASFFHLSFGGYHAAKPNRAQHLFDYHLSQNNASVLNLLNIKYLIQTDESGSPVSFQNEGALGNAWFIKQLKVSHTEDEFLASLDSLNVAQEASVLSNYSGSTKFFELNGQESIQLTSYKMDQLTFESNNNFDGFAVFSEMYYSKGWVAAIDGKPSPIIRVDYAMRGIEIPKGKHKITMSFNPKVISVGRMMSLGSLIFLLAMCLILKPVWKKGL